MAGGFQRLNLSFSNLQFEAVTQRDVWKCGSRFGSDINFRSGSRGQFFVSRDKIGVQVGFKNVADFKFLLFCGLQVNIDVALGINDGCFTFRTQQVGGVRQTTEVELFEIHNRPPRRSQRSQIKSCSV